MRRGAETLWATTAGPNEAGAPQFGGAEAVYNVIDTRQAYLQDVVAEGLRALEHAKEAENSIHFDYEIVALTPRCAAEMGYELSAGGCEAALCGGKRPQRLWRKGR